MWITVLKSTAKLFAPVKNRYNTLVRKGLPKFSEINIFHILSARTYSLACGHDIWQHSVLHFMLRVRPKTRSCSLNLAFFGT